MSNRGKAMAHLRVIHAYMAFARKRGTSFLGLPAICDIEERANDALELLKEQEAKSPVVREKNGYWDHVCPTCGSRDEELFREWNYCPFCGQEVKWKDD